MTMRLLTCSALLGLFLFVFAAGPLAAFAQEMGAGSLSAFAQDVVNADTMEHHLGFWDRLGKELNLNAGQQALLEQVKTATRNYWQANVDLHRTTHEIFKNEGARPTPDIDKAGLAVKAAFRRDVVSAHDALTDAEVALYKSFTAEQRQKVAGMHGRGKAGEN